MQSCDLDVVLHLSVLLWQLFNSLVNFNKMGEQQQSPNNLHSYIFMKIRTSLPRGERGFKGATTRESASIKDSASTRPKRFHMKNYLMSILNPDKTSLKMHTQFALSELSSQIKSVANQAL